MTLEASIVCLDDSEFMRNGDFSPTRLEAQQDAVNFVCGRKLDANPEATVGVMTMAGDQREVLTTLTSDIGKVLTSVHNVRPNGKLDLLSGIQVAQLVLKYRQPKHLKQRIIAFVGSPVEATERELTRLGAKLKKSNISVDVISFGEEEANTEKLEAFIKAVNKDDTSHLVTVPSGVRVLSDALMTSDMFGAAPAGGFNDYPGGIDPSIDPEMAMVMRASLEEERERVRKAEAEAAAASADGGAPAEAATATAAPEENEMDADLRRAMAESMGMEIEGGQGDDVSAMTEEEMMARAMAMSMASLDADDGAGAMETEGEGGGVAMGAAEGEGDAAAAAMLQDPGFLSDVLSGLEGVDPEDAEIREAVSDLASKVDGAAAKEDKDGKDESK
mmetsp:Transcript_13566/g.34910  ORF Transcript_13566/g.34910 Transcript_13566/m.34910 type:complete len:389 (-) Transcript_13566:134-1300(-)